MVLNSFQQKLYIKMLRVWYAYAIPRIISLHFNRCYNIIQIRHRSTESWGKLVYHVTQILGCRIAFCDTSFGTPKLNLKWSRPISLILAKYTDTLVPRKKQMVGLSTSSLRLRITFLLNICRYSYHWCATIRWHTFELLQWLDLVLPGIEFLCPIWATSSPCNSHSSLGIKLIQSLCFGWHLCLDNLWNIPIICSSIMIMTAGAGLLNICLISLDMALSVFLKIWKLSWNISFFIQHSNSFLFEWNPHRHILVIICLWKSWMAHHSHSTQPSTHT